MADCTSDSSENIHGPWSMDEAQEIHHPPFAPSYAPFDGRIPSSTPPSASPHTAPRGSPLEDDRSPYVRDPA
ncbi:hypothetical protein Landi51_12502 [Colletotrichum acutatum]